MHEWATSFGLKSCFAFFTSFWTLRKQNWVAFQSLHWLGPSFSSPLDKIGFLWKKWHHWWRSRSTFCEKWFHRGSRTFNLQWFCFWCRKNQRQGDRIQDQARISFWGYRTRYGSCFLRTWESWGFQQLMWIAHRSWWRLLSSGPSTRRGVIRLILVQSYNF